MVVAACWHSAFTTESGHMSTLDSTRSFSLPFTADFKDGHGEVVGTHVNGILVRLRLLHPNRAAWDSMAREFFFSKEPYVL